MVTLYASKGTGSVAPEAVLALAGAEHEIVWIDYGAGEHHSESFRAINPRGQLPALKLDDGTMVTESAAIMLQLADMYPQAQLIGAPGSSQRAETYRWLVFMATNVYEDFLRMAYAKNYTSDPAGEQSVAESGAAAMDRSWGIINDALAGREHFSGTSLSVADIYLTMLLSWHRNKPELEARCPNVFACARKTISVPQIQAVFAGNDSSI